jgi:hypothetical protein
VCRYLCRYLVIYLIIYIASVNKISCKTVTLNDYIIPDASPEENDKQSPRMFIIHKNNTQFILRRVMNSKARYCSTRRGGGDEPDQTDKRAKTVVS